MGVTAENVATDYKVSREDQDKFALESNRRAYEAQKTGKFKDEIIPINAWKYTRTKSGKKIRETVVFDADDGIRWPTTIEEMAKLKFAV
jgi:acetyl-CoA acyltransferase